MTTDQATSTTERAAREALTYFTRGTRDSGESFYHMNDDRPEELFDSVYLAHGDMGPDDFVFETFVDALEYIADNDADDDSAHDFADGSTDVYTRNLLAWVSSNLTRVGFVDEACEEYGITEPDLCKMLMLGQYHERESIYRVAWEYVEARAEYLDETDDTDDESDS